MFFLSGSFPETASESGLIQYHTLMTLPWCPVAQVREEIVLGFLDFALDSEVLLCFIFGISTSPNGYPGRKR